MAKDKFHECVKTALIKDQFLDCRLGFRNETQHQRCLCWAVAEGFRDRSTEPTNIPF